MELLLPIKIWQQMQNYTELSLPNEVTGIGTIQVLDRNRFRVDEIFLPRQKVSPNTSDFLPYALNDIIYDLMLTDPKRVASLCFRFHSHADGSVFWSERDERDIRDCSGDWAINLVMNSANETLARFDQFSPIRLSNLPVDVVLDFDHDEQLRQTCAREIAERVQVVPHLPPGAPFPNLHRGVFPDIGSRAIVESLDQLCQSPTTTERSYQS